jgi:hypothetical protein
MRTDSTLLKAVLAASVGVIVYVVIDSLFDGFAPWVAFIVAVLAAWFIIRR